MISGPREATKNETSPMNQRLHLRSRFRALEVIDRPRDRVEPRRFPTEQARQTLKAALTGPQPATFEERLAIVDLLVKRQIAKKKLNEAATVGEKAFGRFWLGAQTDWKRIADWEA